MKVAGGRCRQGALLGPRDAIPLPGLSGKTNDPTTGAVICQGGRITRRWTVGWTERPIDPVGSVPLPGIGEEARILGSAEKESLASGAVVREPMVHARRGARQWGFLLPDLFFNRGRRPNRVPHFVAAGRCQPLRTR